MAISVAAQPIRTSSLQLSPLLQAMTNEDHTTRFPGRCGHDQPVYILHGCAEREEVEPIPRSVQIVGRPNTKRVDARDWLLITQDGEVIIHTGRTEIGQGLTTVLYNLVAQALELPYDKIKTIMGDTGRCPSDGPTTGSAATRFIGWEFWLACHEIRADLVLLAAHAMNETPENLQYRGGKIISLVDESQQVDIGELANGQVKRLRTEIIDNQDIPEYVDMKTLNVRADAIVTGSEMYSGDYLPDGCLYGGSLIPPFHDYLTRPISVGLDAAMAIPGVKDVYEDRHSVTAIADSFSTVQKALAAVQATWQVPEQSAAHKTVEQIRAGAKFRRYEKNEGDAKAALADADRIDTETYRTHYATQVPIEPPTTLANVEDGQWTVYASTQNPFLDRHDVAREVGLPAEDIRIISTACGGGFGCKAGHTVPEEAAGMAKRVKAPVKYIYPRLADIQKLSRYKETVTVDISTGLSSDGQVIARTIDIYGDQGKGDRDLYAIANARTRLFRAPMLVRHATMRGTSFSQNVFAIESHTDMVARAIGEDPLEFRRRNVALPQYGPLLDACAEMFDHPRYHPPSGQGVGFAICTHGGRQLGAVGVEVRVDSRTGVVEVVRMAGAFDIGLVINANTATMGIKGAMIWGLGYALLEEVDLDGHSCRTTGFHNYHIPRMKDIPPIEIRYFDTVKPGEPRGCGEMPTPPTSAAIANAVFNATGKRFYRLPLTPDP
jgi:nicotinate dehydrogenase subunit B